MKESKNKTKIQRPSTPISGESGKKAYTAPLILSVERLEAAAATCSEFGPVDGKSFPGTCTVLGS